MLIKEFTEMTDPEVWNLSENDDIIIFRKDSNQQRVLINYKTYQNLKDSLIKLQQQNSNSLTTQFDLNPYLQDFIDIIQNDQFEDITDDDNYFQNFTRRIKSGE